MVRSFTHVDRHQCTFGTDGCSRRILAGDVLVNESWIGSRFLGKIVGETTVSKYPAIIPSITGRAWIMGEAEWVLDSTDPFPIGFTV